MPEKERSETLVTVEWGSSKELFSHFIRDVVSNEQQQNKLLNADMVDYFFLEGFIYDLGHPGRSYTDFPKTILLVIPDNGLSVRNLLGQLGETIERYITTTNRLDPDLRAGAKAQLVAMERLRKSIEGKVRIELRNQYDGKSPIRAISLETE